MSRNVWQSVLGEIELSVSRAAFQTWFSQTKLISSSDNEVVIEVPNIFAKRQFEAKFNTQVLEVLGRNGFTSPTVRYEVSGSKRATTSREISLTTSQPNPSKGSTSSSQPTTQHVADPGLNPRYTFANFIVGGSNDLAYAACQAVAESPGEKYNPLFLYGGVGLGKTHLMQAVGNAIKSQSPEKNILYVSSETFIKEFTEAIRFKRKFSDKYRMADVLIIDDMQFIAGKEKTQEEFFHTFNLLHQANKQIIISSDKPPRSIPTLTERLRSRFEWGMTIDIQMPDFETRCAIVEAKAAISNIDLGRETIEYLANNVKTNVRELEGALNHLLAYAEMRGVPADISTAEGLLGSVKHSRPQHITAKQIIDKTARYFSISPVEICSAKRAKHIVTPRQIAMYLLRSELKMSFPQISTQLGRKDHTTAIHSVEKIERAIKLDFTIREQVAAIRDKLYA